MEFFDFGLVGFLVRLLLGLVIGFCIGLTGIGGGVLVLPALTVLLQLDPIKAVGTTTLYAFLTKIIATIHHIKLKTIDWNISLKFLAGAVPATLATALWISQQGADYEFQAALANFIVGIVFFAVGVIILDTINRIRSRSTEHMLAEHGCRHPQWLAVLSAALGVFCGGLVGATAIGGGVLIVPMFIIFFKLTASRTVGSAIFIAFIMTMLTSLVYGTRGEQDAATSIVMSAGSIAGVRLGSRLSVRVPDLLLRGLVIGLALLGAIMMLFNVAWH